MLDKQETGNRSHFPKVIQKDKQGSVITGSTSLKSRLTAGPIVTVSFAGRFEPHVPQGHLAGLWLLSAHSLCRAGVV